MSNYEEQPYSNSNLDSPEYRKRLMRKLNTLMAVLEVACTKVQSSLEGPDADVDRLTRIHKNLSDTMDVCKRAKIALERSEKLPDDLPAELKSVARETQAAAGAKILRGSQIEMSSEEEAARFGSLPPIEAKEIRACDLDALCDQFESWEA